MPKKSIFKTDFGGVSLTTDPEALFRDLRGRSPDIKHLWSHQADILRAYDQKFLKAKDVAVELPTGAGKTLVGLLIGEYRRRSLSERVAYVCPTRQLANQVGAQAAKYGIKAHIFIGKQRDYPPLEFSEFQSGRAIGITTYSGIFNSNPRISDANCLILDDAHASESYIASMWSVEVSRGKAAALYTSLVDLFRKGLPADFFADIKNESGNGERKTLSVEIVPGQYVRENSAAMRDLLEASLEAQTSSWYSWELIKQHLAACNVFISWDSVLIRPLVPPTLVHRAFNQANQRVYMSATLGAGGELERITGVKSIQRLPLPAGWDKRGSGRRLFLIPQVSMSDNSAMRAILDAVQNFPRSLVLAPTQRDAAQFKDLLEKSGIKIFEASDIEDSLDGFILSENAALVLSRYDGLDLPDESCRLLIVGGLPSGTNLQEQFLWSRIFALSVLRDRVLTRFTQGVGRCTRSDNDYAVVFVWGRQLVDFILKRENRRILKPELQAELEFGIENSRDAQSESFRELWEAFIDQGEEWKSAEGAIVSLRERFGIQDDPISQRLSAIVGDEISYLYSMWNGDFEAALLSARKVADALGGDETKGYRGWWYYLAADAAVALHEATQENSLLGAAEDLLRRATNCCVAISWLARLARSTRGERGNTEPDELTAVAVEKIRERLAEWGSIGKRFEDHIAKVKADIQSEDHKGYHRGLKALGEMLGFQSDLPPGNGAPDCIWSIGADLYIVHEAKSEKKMDGPIGINDVRQAVSHENWVKTNLPVGRESTILCLIESSKNTVAADALPHAKGLYHVSPEEMGTLVQEISTVLRRVRGTMTDLGDEKILEKLHKEISLAELTPSLLITRLERQSVSRMPTESFGKKKISKS